MTSSNYHDRDRDHQTPRKKSSGANAAATVGILKALEPHLDTQPHHKDHADDSRHSSHHSRSFEKKEKKGFWERASGRDKEKDKARAREKERREEEGPGELTRMIGTSTTLIPCRNHDLADTCSFHQRLSYCHCF